MPSCFRFILSDATTEKSRLLPQLLAFLPLCSGINLISMPRQLIFFFFNIQNRSAALKCGRVVCWSGPWRHLVRASRDKERSKRRDHGHQQPVLGANDQLEGQTRADSEGQKAAGTVGLDSTEREREKVRQCRRFTKHTHSSAKGGSAKVSGQGHHHGSFFFI